MNQAVLSPVNTEKRKELGLKAGDTVRVHQKIEEKGKTRIQVFEGLVLFRKHGATPGGTFTVRRVASGVGVERTFPLYSPSIDKIEIVKRTKVRRAKLYYIRDKVAREIRRAMRGAVASDVSTGSAIEEAKAAEEEAKKEAERAEAEAAKKAEEAENAKAEAEEAATDAAEESTEKEAEPENTETPEEQTEENKEKARQ